MYLVGIMPGEMFLSSIRSRNEYFLVKRTMFFCRAKAMGRSCVNANSNQQTFLIASLTTLSAHTSFLFLGKKKQEYVEDDRQSPSRMSLCSVHNLVEK